MNFVNEIMLQKDIERFNIKSIDDYFLLGGFEPGWTRSENKDVYLRLMHLGREEEAGQWIFTFFWRGELLYLSLKVQGGGSFLSQWRRYDLYRLGKLEKYWELKGIELPENIKGQKSELLSDLKEALVCFRDLGHLSEAKEFDATFGF